MFTLMIIGEEVTEIKLHFKIPIIKEGDMVVEHRNFYIKTAIDSKQLINELKKSTTERDYRNIELNKIFNFSDFVFSNNEIPIRLNNNNVLEYCKLTNSKKSVIITYYTMDRFGTNRKQREEEYDTLHEAIVELKNIFEGFPQALLLDYGFNVEYTE
jgi:hypothetical protein